MTTDERRLIINAACVADGGCIYCASSVIGMLIRTMPNEPWRKDLEGIDDLDGWTGQGILNTIAEMGY